MSLLDALIAYAVLSYIVVGINWVRADYHPAPWRIAGAFLWWPGWLIDCARIAILNASATADSPGHGEAVLRTDGASTPNSVPGHE